MRHFSLLCMAALILSCANNPQQNTARQTQKDIETVKHYIDSLCGAPATYKEIKIDSLPSTFRSMTFCMLSYMRHTTKCIDMQTKAMDKTLSRQERQKLINDAINYESVFIPDADTIFDIYRKSANALLWKSQTDQRGEMRKAGVCTFTSPSGATSYDFRVFFNNDGQTIGHSELDLMQAYMQAEEQRRALHAEMREARAIKREFGL